jgi:hypothetical protein
MMSQGASRHLDEASRIAEEGHPSPGGGRPPQRSARLGRERQRAVRPSHHLRPLTVAARQGIDWRGWIALTWVMVWGWAYALMAIQARSPQVLEWIRALSRVAFPGDPQ